jgi:aspartyl aminopeptidase
MLISDLARERASDLLDYIDEGVTPWHVVAESARRLEDLGFQALDERETWCLKPGDARYVIRRGTGLIAFRVGQNSPAKAGFQVAGAHTDSPCFRVKPKGEHAKDGMLRLGVEVYGGPIVATWADRDLGLAGRVMLKDKEADGGLRSVLVRFDEALLRLPTPAVHLNRDVNSKGLLFDKQNELPLLFCADEGGDGQGQLLSLLASALSVEPSDITHFELCTWDLQAGAFWGPAGEFFSAARIDNLAGCHAILTALCAQPIDAVPEKCAVAALFDHEEIGSESDRGAAGSFLTDTLERLSRLDDSDPQAWFQAKAASFLLSVDGAHATHPNYPGFHEAQHRVLMNQGPAVKLNANLRYATDAETAARFALLAEAAAVPTQDYVHRTNLPCGSTIGPMSSAKLGMAAADVGSPMLSMHSVRETAGVMDQHYMIEVLTRFFA